MATGERIHFFRALRGLTLRQLGQAIGFPEKSADIRMAQYESETRVPKDEITQKLAEALDVSPQAIAVPDIDSYTGLMHTFFALEDRYGLKISQIDGELCLRLNKIDNKSYLTMFDMLYAWQQMSEKLASGEITKEEYDQWRYHYPKFDTTSDKANVPSQEFSDAFVNALNNNE
jgi:transcriptional regulator with XRE-family HTH domain